MKNWKTTVMGVLTLIFTGFKIYTNGGADAQDVAAISAGVGLIGAKDLNVTGGTTNQ